MTGRRRTRPEPGVDASTRAARVIRLCAHCGEEFEPVRPLQSFCRPSCRRAHFQRTDDDPQLPLGDLDALFRDDTFE